MKKKKNTCFLYEMDHSLMYGIVLYSLLGTHAHSFAKLEKTPEIYFIFATCEH